MVFMLMFCSHAVQFSIRISQWNFQRYGSKKYDPNRKALPYKTLLVDQSGHENFSSVQSAIDSIPSENKNWVCIYIRAGTYW